MSKLNAGLIGVGRLGKVYARDLATRLTGVRFAGVADTNAKLAEETAREFDVPKWYADPFALIDDPAIDTVIIVSPTHAHRDHVVACAGRGQADVLREAAGAFAARGANHEGCRGPRAQLPADGLHAPLRCGLRRGEKENRRRRRSELRLFSSRRHAIRTGPPSNMRIPRAAAA